MRLLELEKEREAIVARIGKLGDMKSGSISIRFQKCGKRPCICHSTGHPGHGPIYSFSRLADGKTRIQNYKPGPELEKLAKETEHYHEFKELSQKLIEINNEICELRPVPIIEDTDELEALKKKLKRHFMKKYRKRLIG